MADEDRPSIRQPAPDLLWIWRAWHQLHSEREWLVSFGGATPRGVRASTVAALAEREGLSEDELDLLQEMVRQMDAVFFEHHEASKPKGKK
ncbi:hypothetical protein [Roseomonas sp. USHLN139]|uniref:hypothetical protein n=1 Tax=Roseomonas sp. USHLN139 TaxID=3081298 RepID=UPI003B0169B6